MSVPLDQILGCTAAWRKFEKKRKSAYGGMRTRTGRFADDVVYMMTYYSHSDDFLGIGTLSLFVMHSQTVLVFEGMLLLYSFL